MCWPHPSSGQEFSCFGKNREFEQSKLHYMAKQVKTDKEMKVEDAFYNSSVSFNELFQKIRERDALIISQKENIVLLKRQLALQETIFSKMYEFTSQLQQQMNMTSQEAKIIT
jgi:hypothetical protein